MQPIHDFGGNGPVINIAIANGFPPQTYAPFAEPLTAHHRVVCLLPRPLWGNPPPARRLNWRDLIADDLINGLREHHLTDTVLIGHSFGGIASLLASMSAARSRTKALILLDPTILPAIGMWVMKAVQFFGGERGNPLAQRAMKRQHIFESHDAAYEKFKTKRLFADWDDAAVRAYADSMKPTADGKVTLAWSREWEAYIFKTLYTKTWNDLHDFPHDLPLLVIRGGTSDTFLPSAAQRMRRIIPEMTYTEIDGHGHLFPQSAPTRTQQIITDWLSTLP